MKVRKLLVIHPSRGRPVQAARARDDMFGTMTRAVPWRYCLSLDRDDLALPEYLQRFDEAIVGLNPSVVMAVNRAARTVHDDEDLIFNLADDYAFTPGWDQRLLDFIATIPQPEYFVCDPSFPNCQQAGTLQFVSTDLYRKLGYFFYHEYFSMEADHDLMESARARKALFVSPPLGIDHLHPTLGKGQWDETYNRENTLHAYQSGASLFARRQQENFGV